MLGLERDFRCPRIGTGLLLDEFRCPGAPAFDEASDAPELDPGDRPAPGVFDQRIDDRFPGGAHLVTPCPQGVAPGIEACRSPSRLSLAQIPCDFAQLAG